MSRRRRQRFTVTCSHRSSDEVVKRVILAYSAIGAGDYYATRGYTVLEVARGDYRAQQAGGWHWSIDQEALDAAVELLGLKLPVKIRFNSRVGNTNGNYRLGAGYHDIMLKTYRTAQQASQTLWHELTHAMQAERAGGTRAAWLADLEKSRGKYQRCPREIEARAMARDMADLLLCR